MKLKYMDLRQLRTELMEIRDSRLILAMQVAEFAHDGVTRHTMRPGCTERDSYVMHPYRNALRAHRIKADIEAIIICVLHDTVEDAPRRVLEFFCQEGGDVIELYRTIFGDRVADGVDGITIRKGDNYNEHVIANVTANHDVLVAKIMDLKDNAGSLMYTPDEARRVKLAAKYKETVDDIAALLESAYTPIDARLHNVIFSTKEVVDMILGKM